MTSSFCNETNIKTSLHYLNDELEIFGCSTVLYNNENDRDALIKLINVTWTMISDFKPVIVKCKEQSYELSKLQKQIGNHNVDKNRIEKLLNKEKHECLAMKDSLSSALSAKKDLEKQLRECKLEIKKLNKFAEIYNLQHGNEMLSKENEILNLRHKLDKFVKCEAEEENISLHHFSQLTRKNPKLEKYLTSLINNVQTVILENANIRNLILKIFIELTNKCQTQKLTNAREIVEYFLNLPGEDLINKVEKKLEFIIKKIKVDL